MSDDFNTAKTLAVLFEITTFMNSLKDGHVKTGAVKEMTFKQLVGVYQEFVNDVLGLTQDIGTGHELIDGVMDILIRLRSRAKLDRNFELSDRIRDELKQLGITLKDGRDGTEYTFES